MVKIDRTTCNCKRPIIDEIRDAWKMQDPGYNKESLKSEQNIGWNIYKPYIKVKDWVTHFHWIHFVFKYKVIVPILLILDRVLDKYLEREIPEEAYNKNLQLFNEAWNLTLDIWATQYLQHNRSTDKTVEKQQFEYARHGSGGARSMRTIRDIGLTMCLNDTAYREFLNIFVFTLTRLTNEAYKNSPIAEHIFYTQKHINDIHYYHLINIRNTKNTAIYRTNKPE